MNKQLLRLLIINQINRIYLIKLIILKLFIYIGKLKYLKLY